ncbi:uncharacterized protein LOC110496479 [Oncorhynchus mykiss]|uniref:uncharacterized protein LOC110496479 n=1 Tax=Oncorhynchus mykiss TaxID=8022 RepID=UPI000B4EF8BA|nr:uncharacterized protein LOC110496479 [Oncorhynchus mykiss]
MVAANSPKGSEPSSSGSGPNSMQEHLRKNKDILGKQHSPIDYLSISSESGDNPGSFMDVTLSKREGYTVPLQCHQHEAAMIGDAFRSHGQVCNFIVVYQSQPSVPGEDVILLTGVAGSGKTTLVRRLLVHVWIRASDSQKLEALSFRELNLLSEPQSLLELLLTHFRHLFWTNLSTPNMARSCSSWTGSMSFPLDFEGRLGRHLAADLELVWTRGI